MLRFFSKRHKPRRDQKAGALERYGNLRAAGAEGGPPPPGRASKAATGPSSSKERERMRKANKNSLECRVILLDGADLPITIMVSKRSIAIGPHLNFIHMDVVSLCSVEQVGPVLHRLRMERRNCASREWPPCSYRYVH